MDVPGPHVGYTFSVDYVTDGIVRERWKRLARSNLTAFVEDGRVIPSDSLPHSSLFWYPLGNTDQYVNNEVTTMNRILRKTSLNQANAAGNAVGKVSRIKVKCVSEANQP